MRRYSFQWFERPPGLFRDPRHGKIAGVCAGLGAYFEVRPKFIRLAMILGCVFGLFIPIILGYVLLTVLLPTTSSAAAYDGRAAADPWREEAAGEKIDSLKERFRGLDRRLAAIETKVTSEEFLLRQKFRDL
ncbi:MAG TPA: PspC domain-containing protein [Telmatospirillum sp.]|nr:PspC domain-containing protein [Telmatospirillum sp.]